MKVALLTRTSAIDTARDSSGSPWFAWSGSAASTTMVNMNVANPVELLCEQIAGASPDVLQAMIKTFAQEVSPPRPTRCAAPATDNWPSLTPPART
ncbi:hypothetical protein ABZ807_32695 [Micromonospora sp. NPDC047548]|uniref:hypothetical protein n=1 Tax=Micromonospora sp. NPDC047548 TaxID=3155624 RepID=UPI003400B621